MKIYIETFVDNKLLYDKNTITIFECEKLTNSIIIAKSFIHQKKIALLSMNSLQYIKGRLVIIKFSDENGKIRYTKDISEFITNYEYKND